jgi:hypothetical protein
MDAALLLVLAALTAFSLRLIPVGSDGDTLIVRTYESMYGISLKDEGEYPVQGTLGQAVLVVRDGEAWLRNAPCPLKICEGMGPVSKAGEIILCLPNRIQILVSGEVDVDAVSR